MSAEEQKQLDELAKRVADSVVAEPIQQRLLQVLQTLLLSQKSDVLRSAMESLLLYRGTVALKRDQEWSRIMAAIWFQEGDAEPELPTSPHDLQTLIMAWQSKRERRLAVDNYNQGLSKGFAEGVVEGTNLGYGAAKMDKGLDETLMAAKRKRPTL